MSIQADDHTLESFWESLVTDIGALQDTLKLVVTGGTVETARGVSMIDFKFVFRSAHFSQKDDPYHWLTHWLSKRPGMRKKVSESITYGEGNELVHNKLYSQEYDIYYCEKFLRIYKRNMDPKYGLGSLQIRVITRLGRNKDILKELVLEAQCEYEKDIGHRVHISMADGKHVIADQAKDSFSSSWDSATINMQPRWQEWRSNSVGTEDLERRRSEDPIDLPAKDPPHLFNSSKNFSINDGHFNAIGGDMNSSTYNNESSTLIFNQCIFSNGNPTNLKNASSESASSNHTPSSPHSPDPPSARTTPPTYSHPKRRSRWSTTTFIPVYYHYVQPIVMYPMHWISSYCVPMVANWFNWSPAPWGCWSYPAPA
ncbi:hypothetical protein GYMLUDRAFT_262116 [Collybiopsis luxurians FD-317 M1]|uniref:BCS1 N-terminal domain-containing protein n=1 Tax=Collybiopsis luxurians FD-317 M1 TaxID=944289 RepID=A0A0D0CLD0_9AGAR|nr:hypothetical protein GYMLUDRAFT_262116 [Collybiopsis luxurians FD-317 M1]